VIFPKSKMLAATKGVFRGEALGHGPLGQPGTHRHWRRGIGGLIPTFKSGEH